MHVTSSVHGQFLDLVEILENRFAVRDWKLGDVDVWPLARMDLYLDMYWQEAGTQEHSAGSRLRRIVTSLATPLRNLWRSRHDLDKWVIRPRSAYAIVLGDGVCLDRSRDAWQDRFAEPIMAALQGQGHATFLMQGGELTRLPWLRPTFASNCVPWLAHFVLAGRGRRLSCPDHDAVLRFLERQGISCPSLQEAALARRARKVAAQAVVFEGLLAMVKPTLAFVTTYYAGLGAAFVLACRRRGVLSVDLQHCPHEGAHKAYRFAHVPAAGYSTLPAVFWTWSQGDVRNIERWSASTARPWHRAVHGGHTQIAGFMNDEDPSTQDWERRVNAAAEQTRFGREILVALQPIAGRRCIWEALSRVICAAPRSWRWWIRRHPAAHPAQDIEYASLLALASSNVIVDAASSLPLPALLRHVDAVVSLASGAAAEAEAFGVPAYFLSAEARVTFGALIDRGAAQLITVEALPNELAGVRRVDVKAAALEVPIAATLKRLQEMADEYGRWSREPHAER